MTDMLGSKNHNFLLTNTLIKFSHSIRVQQSTSLTAAKISHTQKKSSTKSKTNPPPKANKAVLPSEKWVRIKISLKTHLSVAVIRQKWASLVHPFLLQSFTPSFRVNRCGNILTAEVNCRLAAYTLFRSTAATVVCPTAATILLFPHSHTRGRWNLATGLPVI